MNGRLGGNLNVDQRQAEVKKKVRRRSDIVNTATENINNKPDGDNLIDGAHYVPPTEERHSVAIRVVGTLDEASLLRKVHHPLAVEVTLGKEQLHKVEVRGGRKSLDEQLTGAVRHLLDVSMCSGDTK